MMNITNEEKILFEDLVKEEVGHLGIVLPNGYPRVVPINFVEHKDAIYFHGSLKGEKYEALKAGAKVSFTIAEALAVVPAHWYSDRGCGANHFFRSASIYGISSLVDDLVLKAKVLEALNKKYIPEGGYEKITVDEPRYQRPLQYTGVFQISIEKVTFRENTGKNYNDEKVSRLTKALEKRNTEKDKLTLRRIRRNF